MQLISGCDIRGAVKLADISGAKGVQVSFGANSTLLSEKAERYLTQPWVT